MEQVLSSGSSMITEASGNAREIAEQIGAQPTLEGLIVTGIVGLLICFFGLKLIRLQAALVGFLMGALIGIGVAWTAGISGLTFAIVVFRPYLRHRSICLRDGAGCIVVFPV